MKLEENSKCVLYVYIIIALYEKNYIVKGNRKTIMKTNKQNFNSSVINTLIICVTILISVSLVIFIRPLVNNNYFNDGYESGKIEGYNLGLSEGIERGFNKYYSNNRKLIDAANNINNYLNAYSKDSFRLPIILDIAHISSIYELEQSIIKSSK